MKLRASITIPILKRTWNNKREVYASMGRSLVRSIRGNMRAGQDAAGRSLKMPEDGESLSKRLISSIKYIESKRRPRVEPTGKRRDGKTNYMVMVWQHKRHGRNIMKPGRREQRLVQNAARRAIRKRLRIKSSRRERIK